MKVRKIKRMNVKKRKVFRVYVIDYGNKASFFWWSLARGCHFVYRSL